MTKKHSKDKKFRTRLKAWWLRRRLISKISLSILASLLLLIVLAVAMAWYYRFTQRHQPIEYGVSFSVKYAEELGVDWQDNLTALLDDLEFRNFRLMSYWDDHEAQKDVYDFATLDWQMDEVAKRDGNVKLSIGLRQPRWPECHLPQWAEGLSLDERNDELFEYIATVVERYREHPALQKWQLENEYFNRNFGKCDDFSRQRLTDELNLVKGLDPDHDVVISFADQLGMPLRGPHPDEYATSLYRGNYVRGIGHFAYPITSHFYGAKSLLVRWLHGREVVLHELQLEPWGPTATRELSDEVQAEYMDEKKMAENILFARRTGMKEIYFWGGEWWYWQKQYRGNDGPWETIRENLQKTKPASSIFN